MKGISLLPLLLLVLMTASCQSETASQANEIDITIADFKEKMVAENTVILDVRTARETANGIIEGAQEIDFRSDGFRERIAALDKEKTYLVYCKSGGRSSSATSMMKEMGFENVYNLLGGYDGWSKEN